MKTLTILVFLLLAVLAWTISSRHKSTLRKHREAQYLATLTTYAHDFPPGLTRAQVDDLLRARKLTAEQTQYATPTWDKFIKIGQEHSSRLFCGREDVDIRLAFTPSGPTPETPANPTDTLTAVTLLYWSRDCL